MTTYADPVNVNLPGSKNPLPADIHATLPDRLAEHSGESGQKYADYTYANGQLAPSYTATRDPEMVARGGGLDREGESGGPSSLGQAGFNAPVYDGGPIPDRVNVGVPGSKNPYPNDVNAPVVDRDPETPTTSAGSNTPSWSGEGSPSGI